MNRLRIAVLLLLAAPAGVRAQAAAGLVNIGIAAAVHGAVKAAAPQQVGRVVAGGQPVYLNDHVTTGPDGRLQILLLDETTFTLGPDSDMVLDEFVYDPKSGDGKVSARVAKGAFRFVTGKVARKDPSQMKVKLPVGTIGIRGTMVAGQTTDSGAEIVLVGPGRENSAFERRGGITVSNEHGSSSVQSSGYGIVIADGGAPSRGFRFTPERLAGILDRLEPKQAAGAGGPPDAARNSGDALARGGINYNQFQSVTATNQILGQDTTAAGQQAGSLVNNWSDLLAIQSGVAGYQGSGSYTCAGSGCVSVLGGNSGTFSFGFNVDFANRTIGGPSPSISIGSDNFGVNTISYGGFTGQASYTLGPNDVSSGSFGDITGTKLTFLKSGGQPAGALQVDLIYTLTGGNSGTATGSGQAPKGAPVIGG